MYNYKRHIHITPLFRNSITNVSASHTVTSGNDQHLSNRWYVLATDYLDKFDTS